MPVCLNVILRFYRKQNEVDDNFNLGHINMYKYNVCAKVNNAIQISCTNALHSYADNTYNTR